MIRRTFLRNALGASVLAPGLLGTLGRQARAAETLDPNKKLLFIFQRGGSDGINTIIPRGDADYSTANRPTLFVPDASAIDLGNGFAQAHPALAPMMEIYNNSALNGIDGPGNLAIIHRVAYANQSRSHFDSQDYWERGVPGDPTIHTLDRIDGPNAQDGKGIHEVVRLVLSYL